MKPSERDLRKAIKKAGGKIVKMTANGHLIVQGPAGICVVGPKSWDSGPRGYKNQLAQLRKWAGLDV